MSYGKSKIGSDTWWQSKIDQGVIKQKPNAKLCLFCGRVLGTSENVACNNCWSKRNA
jgi:hypothetical protein|tara:strand:- start:1259 stop:1429 length:171 start_codon:yes stop_codon:yes gene_type:complete